MNSTNKLGDELKTARIIKGLSLREVENVTGISNSYLSQLENNKIKKPAIQILHRLSKLYEINFDKILSTSGLLLDIDNEGPSTIVGTAFHSKGLSLEEEKLLGDYLAFLRFNNKKKKINK